MKKLLVSVLAIAGLVACSQEQTLVSKSPASMEFGVASLDKATRVDPSLTTDNLQGFNVWAWMDSEDGNVLTAEDVERMGKGWGYVNTAYWLPGHNYSFAALAPMDSENWTYNLNVADNGEDNTIDFKNIDGTEDLIYAFNTRSTVGHDVGEDYPVLDLTFNHLLSKTKFTFVNGFATDNVTVQVTDVKMTAKNTATYSIKDAKWGEVAGEEITLAYGDTEVIKAGDDCVVADERLTIPAAAKTSYEITYTVQVWYGKEPGFEGEGLTKKTTLTGWEFEQGKAYNFVAEITPESLNLDEIEFEIKVIEWVKQDVNCGEIDEAFTFVTSAAEIQTILNAATDDVTILFGNDIEGDVVATQKPGVVVTIDGAGHEFDGVIVVDGKSGTYTTAGLTIKNVNFVADAISADACVRLGDGNNATRYTCNVTLDNCTFDVPGAVGVKSYTGGDKNLVISECTATANAHSLVQAKGIDGILVKDCTVLSKNGMNFNNSTNVVVDNCTTDVKGYAVRFGESSGGTGAAEVYTIKNSTLKSACEDGDSVIILRGTADYSTLTIENTTIEGERSIANTATGAKVIVDGNEVTTIASSNNELKNAIVNGATIALTEGTYSLPSLSGKEGVVIIGTEGTVIGGDNASTGFGSNFGKNTTIKNVTFSGTTNGVRWSYAQGGEAVFENCTFAGGSTYGFHIDESKGATFTFNNCVFSGFNAFAGDLVSITFNDCTFEHNGNYGHTNIWSVAYFNNCAWGAGASVSGNKLYFNGVEESWMHEF